LLWESEHPRIAKFLATILGLAIIAAVFSPVVQNWRPQPTDSFPFSYYPMFTDTGIRNDAHSETYLIGLDTHGTRYTIHYSYAAPGGRLVRVRGFIQRMVRRGQADQLCRSASTEIARRNASRLRPVTTLRVVTGTYNLSQYLAGNKTPLAEQVLAVCDIRRGRT
jgi:hypothetical protein